MNRPKTSSLGEMWRWLVISPRRTLHPSSSESSERNYVSKEPGKYVEFPPVCRNIIWSVGIGMEKKGRRQWWVKGLHWIILKLFPSPNSSMILGSAGLSIQGKKVPRTAAGAASHLKRKPFPWDQATQMGFIYIRPQSLLVWEQTWSKEGKQARREICSKHSLFCSVSLWF